MRLSPFVVLLFLCWVPFETSFEFNLVSAEEPVPPIDPKGLVPKDGEPVDIMVIGASPRAVELGNKIKQAASKDPTWWLAHFAKAKPGQPLPYDEKMGITKEEYKEFLDTGKNFGLVKLKTLKVAVKQEEKQITLSFGDELPGWKEVVINLKDNSVSTPFCVATKDGIIKASPGQKVTGPWDGTQWKFDNLNFFTGNGTKFRFAIGKKKDNGRGIIFYEIKKDSGDSKMEHSYILFYDL